MMIPTKIRSGLYSRTITPSPLPCKRFDIRTRSTDVSPSLRGRETIISRISSLLNPLCSIAMSISAMYYGYGSMSTTHDRIQKNARWFTNIFEGVRHQIQWCWIDFEQRIWMTTNAFLKVLCQRFYRINLWVYENITVFFDQKTEAKKLKSLGKVPI